MQEGKKWNIIIPCLPYLKRYKGIEGKGTRKARALLFTVSTPRCILIDKLRIHHKKINMRSWLSSMSISLFVETLSVLLLQIALSKTEGPISRSLHASFWLADLLELYQKAPSKDHPWLLQQETGKKELADTDIIGACGAEVDPLTPTSTPFTTHELSSSRSLPSCLWKREREREWRMGGGALKFFMGYK